MRDIYGGASTAGAQGDRERRDAADLLASMFGLKRWPMGAYQDVDGTAHRDPIRVTAEVGRPVREVES